MNNKLHINIPDDLKYAPVALGLSGGRDSMTLAHLFLEEGVAFFAVNFEHGIRGKNSVSDSEFVKDWCVENGVECLCYSLDVPTYAEANGLTVEQAGRELRYRHFDDLLDSGKCSCVALAHHRDDQAETILMRILRGTGIKGLAAMSERSGNYIRPLINCSRADIDAYVKEKGIAYVDDETNSDTKYTRNFVRALLSEIKERFPSADEALVRLSRNAAEAESYIEKNNEYYPVLSGGEVFLRIDEMSRAHEVGAKLYIMRACELLGVRQDIEERHFPILFNLCGLENGKSVELPHGLTVHKDGEYLVFDREKPRVAEQPDDSTDMPDFEVPFKQEGVAGILKCERADKLCPSPTVLFMDGDKIPVGAVLRHPLEGDKFEKFGGGTKSLGDYLTDKKIPVRHRPKLIVCAAAKTGAEGEHEILFILGVEIANSVRVSDVTSNLIKITKE